MAVFLPVWWWVIVAVCFGAEFPPGLIKEKTPLTIDLTKATNNSVSVPLKVTGVFGFTAVRPPETCLSSDKNWLAFSVGGCETTFHWVGEGLFFGNYSFTTKRSLELSLGEKPYANYEKQKNGSEIVNQVIVDLPGGDFCQPKFDANGKGNLIVYVPRSTVKCDEVLIQLSSDVQLYGDVAENKNAAASGKLTVWIGVLAGALVAIASIVGIAG